jgi:hypothetical protein
VAIRGQEVPHDRRRRSDRVARDRGASPRGSPRVGAVHNNFARETLDNLADALGGQHSICAQGDMDRPFVAYCRNAPMTIRVDIGGAKIIESKPLRLELAMLSVQGKCGCPKLDGLPPAAIVRPCAPPFREAHVGGGRGIAQPGGFMISATRPWLSGESADGALEPSSFAVSPTDCLGTGVLTAAQRRPSARAVLAAGSAVLRLRRRGRDNLGRMTGSRLEST